ncbi:hypothetical protein H4Q26_000865 [Puccinia striiformis f. sp. tritici PST-130]|nr:hypothetical protein Pst134EB_001914 [Puccinia striiformis f. sp. tritici]KAI9601067.1 hypothetical protein H4Q26_000865 [Puccinia striiformis f. sp. tritici PST-130]
MSTTFSDPGYSAENYLDHRPRYPQELYDTILEFHNTPATEGHHECPASQTKVALDLGCGPGIATEALISRFQKVIAIDESEPMIKIARTRLPQVEFHIASATCMPMIESGSVDLITVATAAHWFPDNWWEEAERVLKPGGTVALWTVSHQMIIEPRHPKTHEINESQNVLLGTVSAYFTQGNEYVMGMYDTLPLPASESKFGTIRRWYWNREKVDDSKMLMGSKFNINTLRQRLHTYSPVHRWRTDNPTKKDTEDDPVEQMLSQIKTVSGWDDSTEFIAGHPLALLMTKKLG